MILTLSEISDLLCGLLIKTRIIAIQFLWFFYFYQTYLNHYSLLLTHYQISKFMNKYRIRSTIIHHIRKKMSINIILRSCTDFLILCKLNVYDKNETQLNEYTIEIVQPPVISWIMSIDEVNCKQWCLHIQVLTNCFQLIICQSFERAVFVIDTCLLSQ